VQGSILLGFLGAASKIIDTTDADIWIAGRGRPVLSFPSAWRGASSTSRTAFQAWDKPAESAHESTVFENPMAISKLVTLIGADSV